MSHLVARSTVMTVISESFVFFVKKSVTDISTMPVQLKEFFEPAAT